ncbi:hypothetical protein BLNAU_3124 [Blattamonas nauphoetae]|uniref:Uncharacterized protein n=1 Tax=Blattamonas nauphoetae TaxID=2049346 RepID=A0ABQ9YE90_9EUKA|nr:hypothetical protein BLNAU_3124 [Blattamonas nauphoetae]
MPCIGISVSQKDFVVSTFKSFWDTSPPSTVYTALARISLSPHLRIANLSIGTLFHVFERDPAALTLLPSPIFPSSSPHQQFSDLSFLAALTKKLRIVFSEFQTNLPTDPSHLSEYAQLTKDDPYIITRSLAFCWTSFYIPVLPLRSTPPIEVDSEIIRDLILFVKEAITAILTNITNIDILIASLPSDSSPTTPLDSDVDIQMADSLELLRDECEAFVNNSWCFFINLAKGITDLHKSSFQTIILDDPSITDFILNSLKLPHPTIRRNVLVTIGNIIMEFPTMGERFMTANLVGRMFDTVDFVSLPLSESNTTFELTNFLTSMLSPIGDDEETNIEQYPLIRVSVFEPAKQFITFIFHNSDELILDEAD